MKKSIDKILKLNLKGRNEENTINSNNATNWIECCFFWREYQTCDSGDMTGCNDLGAMYANEKGVKQDHFKAVESYTKACDGGIAEGCLNLAHKYYYGRGCRQSSTKAKEYYGKACDDGNNNGCKYYSIENKK